MKTKFNPFEKLKAVFSRGGAKSEVGAVVYRKTRGNLAILLLKNRRGSWSVPTGPVLGGETEAAAALRLAAERADAAELKVWQALGRISFTSKPAKRGPAGLQLFLIQALEASGGLSGSAAGETVWLTPGEAAVKVGYGEMAGMINLAAAKIRRAQV